MLRDVWVSTAIEIVGKAHSEAAAGRSPADVTCGHRLRKGSGGPGVVFMCFLVGRGPGSRADLCLASRPFDSSSVTGRAAVVEL